MHVVVMAASNAQPELSAKILEHSALQGKSIDKLQRPERWFKVKHLLVKFVRRRPAKYTNHRENQHNQLPFDNTEICRPL